MARPDPNPTAPPVDPAPAAPAAPEDALRLADPPRTFVRRVQPVAADGEAIAHVILYQDVTAERAGDGLGLGLHVSRLIAERHGGRLWLESAPDQGTVAVLVMPLAAVGDDQGPRSEGYGAGRTGDSGRLGYTAGEPGPARAGPGTGVG